MDDLSYQTEDYSGDTVSPSKPKKMKKAYHSVTFRKNVPQWMVDMVTDKDKEFKVEMLVAKSGHDEDQEYGDGKVKVTLSLRSIKKISNGKMSKKDYLAASPEDREKHNKEEVLGEE